MIGRGGEFPKQGPGKGGDPGERKDVKEPAAGKDTEGVMSDITRSSKAYLPEKQKESEGSTDKAREVLDKWEAISTVKYSLLLKKVETRRSDELKQVDAAVAELRSVYQQGKSEVEPQQLESEGKSKQAESKDKSKQAESKVEPQLSERRIELHAALNVQRQVENWEASGSPEKASKRDDAFTQLKGAIGSIVDNFYSKSEQKMRSASSSDGLSGRVRIHGTDAIADILSTGEVYGGTAALKLLGTDGNQRKDVGLSQGEGGARAQVQHFYMAVTNDNGVNSKPGNAFVKGRQAAESKLREGPQGHLPSWKHGMRPLMGVIEFGSPPDDTDLVEDGEKIRSIQTEEINRDHRSTLPIKDLNPVGNPYGERRRRSAHV